MTGQKDISGAAKIVKNFNAEFDKLKIPPAIRITTGSNCRDIVALADLPSIEVLRGKSLLGLLEAGY